MRYDPADGTPVELPVGHDRAPTLKEELQRYVRFVHHRASQEEHFETFDEADDFTEDDPEPDWESQYELVELQDEEGFETPPLDPEETTRPDEPAVDAKSGTPETQASEPATDNPGNPAPPASSVEP